ncbi:hypothetical protein [Stenotrophomonas sp. GZD-301]|jgi:hypothetical protein|uniref:hypothetical protein n=1 Tax=Stenotrophomonas sp. GZD-301 TaxID=3404814 RepID=UPI003BB77EBF
MAEPVKHTRTPVTGEYTLCGVAWDCNHLKDCADEPDVLFADPSEKITCPDCRKVIAYCKTIKRWEATTNG